MSKKINFINIVLNFFFSNSLISIAKDVLPVPPTNILPMQIVLILKLSYVRVKNGWRK